MFNENYDTVADAIRAIKSTMDDIDSVAVFLSRPLADDDGEPVPEVGVVLQYCNGRAGFVSRSVATSLLNDGIFSRLRLPVKYY